MLRDCGRDDSYVRFTNAAVIRRHFIVLREAMGRNFHPVYLWIVVPFVALLWVPFFNRTSPELFGIPFFYWYQMLWTVLGSLCIVPVYLFKKRQRANNKQDSRE